MNIYRLKDFDTFINLLENGTIKLQIKIDIHINENNYGKTYDHGCSFLIQEQDLPKLYYKI